GVITVTGSGGDDSYSLVAPTGGGAMSIDAGGGTDNRLLGLVGSQQFSLGTAVGELQYLGVELTGIQRVEGSGTGNQLIGNAADNALSAPAANQVEANDILLTGIAGVDGAGGSDILTADADNQFSLTGIDGEIDHQSIAFSKLEMVSADGGILAG